MQLHQNKKITAGHKVQSPQNWHQTGTDIIQKAKKPAGANRLTFSDY
jgi:hypothetical protein